MATRDKISIVTGEASESDDEEIINDSKLTNSTAVVISMFNYVDCIANFLSSFNLLYMVTLVKVKLSRTTNFSPI